MIFGLHGSVAVVLIQTIGSVVAALALGSLARRRRIEPLLLAVLLGGLGLAVEVVIVVVAMVRSRGRDRPRGSVGLLRWGEVMAGLATVGGAITLYEWHTVTDDHRICLWVAHTIGGYSQHQITDYGFCHRDRAPVIGWIAISVVLLLVSGTLLTLSRRHADGPERAVV